MTADHTGGANHPARPRPTSRTGTGRHRPVPQAGAPGHPEPARAGRSREPSGPDGARYRTPAARPGRGGSDRAEPARREPGRGDPARREPGRDDSDRRDSGGGDSARREPAAPPERRDGDRRDSGRRPGGDPARLSWPDRVLRALAGILAGGMVVLALGLVVVWVGADRYGLPGPGADVVIGHLIGAVLAVVGQRVADRRPDRTGTLAALVVVGIVVVVLGFAWFL